MTQEQRFRIWWDEELGIARGHAIGVLDEQAAEGIWQHTVQIAEEHGDRIDWLINLSEMSTVTSKARKILAKASGHPSINKYAFAGASVFVRTVANFIAAAAGQTNARHFATEEQALEWLKATD
jgi:hypothetical protein